MAGLLRQPLEYHAERRVECSKVRLYEENTCTIPYRQWFERYMYIHVVKLQHGPGCIGCQQARHLSIRCSCPGQLVSSIVSQTVFETNVIYM